MTKYLLAADATLMTEYRNVPLATFFSCIPSDFWYSRMIHRILANSPYLDEYGRPIRAPYGLRKIEAGLVKSAGRENVQIVDPRRLADSITDDTEVVGLHSMDPLGLGPVSMSFTFGGAMTPYTEYKFRELAAQAQKRGRKFKVALGGPGAWQFNHLPGAQQKFGIDTIVQGEVDHLVGGIFEQIAHGDAPPVMLYDNGTAPSVEQVPRILGPSMHSMVEVMRGCGRGCDFCEVTRRRPRYFSLDAISEEVAINAAAPRGSSIQLHADDIFAYKVEDRRTFEPNADALKELFQRVMSQRGVRICTPSHGTVSAAVANPGLIESLSKIVHAGSSNWVGVQCGAETGSARLAKISLNRKAAPFSADEWPDLVVRGTEIFNKNHWFPAFTVIMGLPDETPDDAWMTVDLLDRLEQLPNSHFIMAPLAFVPVGALSSEGFYDINANMDEARFNVAYHSWRHDVMEIEKDLWRFMDLPGPVKAIIAGIARLGGRYILSSLERYATRRGFRIRRPATSIRAAKGHVIASSRAA